METTHGVCILGDAGALRSSRRFVRELVFEICNSHAHVIRNDSASHFEGQKARYIITAKGREGGHFIATKKACNRI